ncbi:aldo/keto reductase [Halalkalibacillus halophilus]|uniref:aldo/keto reductase n=1 Tax=Halalkalibacillus halophilus TaxID=392827 RepID=UPI000414C87D|nr:aldo/keto reductase [Halalkalibacillus halophilus]
MINSLQDRIQLNNGINIPGIGLGVYKVWEDQEAADTVRTAINQGYRLIDTASFYDNEVGVGQGVQEADANREDVFITSKVWNEEQGYDETLRAFEQSLQKLNMDYLDLYLIHWPVTGKYEDTWKAMERLYSEGMIKSIGVSNFHKHHLEKLFVKANEKPVVNQVEFHPHLIQREVKQYCEREDIKLEAWSPLKRGQVLEEDVIVSLAEKYQKTPAQIILRWDIEQEVITIPKSTNEKRMKENTDIFDFQLTKEEVETINNLHCDSRTGPNPDEF